MSGSEIGTKDLYQTLLETRNLEIKLFWERSNYFLVLNSAIALGFFNMTERRYALVFAVMGILASTLWFWVCLGGKFWQTRWEQRLADFEAEHLASLEFFGASRERISKDVERGLAFDRLGWLQGAIYKLALKRKPSVSYSMIRLSVLFVVGWAAFIVAFMLRGGEPFGS